MITNLPIADDYFQSGKEILNFAWDTTFKLLMEFDETEYYFVNPDEISENYWAAAKRTLTTSLALVQQGVELLLKGKIASISPYLLIADVPSRWPSPYGGVPIDFAEFRTVDAQDLIRIHDTFADTLVNRHFSDKFHTLRKQRNVILHTSGKSIKVHVTDVIEAIFFMHKELFPLERWLNIRKLFLESSPYSKIVNDGVYEPVSWERAQICRETSIIIDLLEPADVQLYLGINKDQRRYMCPKCLAESDDYYNIEFKIAVLRPKSPTATRLYCPVCNEEHEVERKKCEQNDCRGNVLSKEEGICLTCGI